MGRSTTGPSWSVGRPNARPTAGRPTRPPAVLQTTDDDNRRQRAKNTGPLGGPVIINDDKNS